MSWFFTHPYVAGLLGALVLLLTGSLIVANRTPVADGGDDLRAWSGVGADLLSPLAQSPRETEGSAGRDDLYTEVLGGPPFFYNTAPLLVALPEEEETLGLEDLLAAISRPPESAPSASEELDIYSFIPSGLVSISSHEKERTGVQQRLFEYGNEVGSTIETYESSYRNAPQILKDQFEDREDPEKNEAMRQLAEGLARVGESLEGMEEVPEEIAPAHERLIARYKEMGEKLALIPDARSDEAILDAILAYNASVEAFTKDFIALALLFSAHGVAFSEDDPGRIFTFSAAPSF